MILGKSTIARLIAGLISVDSGSIKIDQEVVETKKSDVVNAQKEVQMIFQDPYLIQE